MEFLRFAGLPADVQELDFNCLIVNRQEGHMSIKQRPCDQAVSFMCSGHNSKPIEDELTFTMAKRYCENLQSKLMNLNDIVPPKSGDNVSYWVGTFRQRIYFHDSTTSGIYETTIKDNIQTKKKYTTIYIHKEKTTPGILRVTHEENTQKKVNQSTCNVNQGFSEREVYVYSIGFGGLLILNVSAVSIFVCCRKYKEKQHHQDKTISPKNDNSTNEEEIARVGGSYESIIEQVICDDITSGSEVLSSRIQNSDTFIHTQHLLKERRHSLLHENKLSSEQ
ncbi:Hypothetical predicted protein [Mytilus galloprovincialis]|uniref:Uncharacterized protein n=1 Tax=Mytilus galloprovincialis TaxID=29158 RepID=A0A8B6ESQ7_MYTGA|nr:Hypothetical predicted protein [Mytilus galloprovincialis]